MKPFSPEKIPFDRLKVPTFSWPSASSSIDLEIGGGAGLFAVRYALNHPDRLMISLERTSKFERLLRRIHAHNHPQNLVAVRADAILWVARNVPPQSLDTVFILYPNPYPKTRHENHRWAAMPFMGFLLSRIKPQGHLILASNEPSYIQFTKERMAQWPAQLVDERLLKNTTEPRTHFEKKYILRGDPCVELRFIPLFQNDTGQTI